MNVAYRHGFTLKGIKAEDAWSEVERIRSDHGGAISRDLLVEESRPATAPLHSAFVWKDKDAAHEYRKYQAGRILRGIVVVDESGQSEGPAFVSVDVSGHRAYIPTEEAFRHDITADQVLEDAKIALKGWRKRYGYLKQLSKVFSVIDEELGE